MGVYDYTRTAQAMNTSQARSQPSDDGGRFLQILDLFQSLKIGVPSGCLGETLTFKIIITDNVTLWSKLESTWYNSTRLY